MYTIKNINKKFLKEFPNKNSRTSLELPFGAVYVKWLQKELLVQLNAKRKTNAQIFVNYCDEIEEKLRQIHQSIHDLDIDHVKHIDQCLTDALFWTKQ